MSIGLSLLPMQIMSIPVDIIGDPVAIAVAVGVSILLAVRVSMAIAVAVGHQEGSLARAGAQPPLLACAPVLHRGRRGRRPRLRLSPHELLHFTHIRALHVFTLLIFISCTRRLVCFG